MNKKTQKKKTVVEREERTVALKPETWKFLDLEAKRFKVTPSKVIEDAFQSLIDDEFAEDR